jgi:uncharacterized integral membrane protein
MASPEDERAQQLQPAEPQEAYADAGVVETRGERLRRKARHVRLWTYAIVLVAALVLLIAFIVSNTKHVRVNWVFGHSSTALVWVIVVAALLGWFVGAGMALLFRFRTRRRA